MKIGVLLVALAVMMFWGFWGFIHKLCLNHIGIKATLLWSFSAAIICYLLIIGTFIHRGTRYQPGVYSMLAVVASILGTLALLLFMFVLAREKSSIVVPLTALYPAVTVILLFRFAGEKTSLSKLVGVLLAIIAAFLLAR
jgi:transporter family protein